MKVLVVGNMGYIGPVLTRHLRQVYPQASLIGFDINKRQAVTIPGGFRREVCDHGAVQDRLVKGNATRIAMMLRR